jgi:hypothetical protein
MSDPSLRLPNTNFRAVLNLGPKRAALLTLPDQFAEPELMGEWDDEEKKTILYVHFADGDLHLEASDDRFDYHFHTDNHEDASSDSPWAAGPTTELLAWAGALVTDFHAQMPDLQIALDDASAWYDDGFLLYVCEVEEPVQLDLVEVEVEGQMLTLPWLGAGHVGHEHIDGLDHPIELLWNPEHEEPDLRIATAWLDPVSGEPRTGSVAGIDWHAVGLPEDEVLAWLEGIYINHHVIADIEDVLTSAVLARMGGLG